MSTSITADNGSISEEFRNHMMETKVAITDIKEDLREMRRDIDELKSKINAREYSKKHFTVLSGQNVYSIPSVC